MSFIPGVYFTDIHEISMLITNVVPEWLRDHKGLKIDDIEYGFVTNPYKGFSSEPADIEYFKTTFPEFTWVEVDNKIQKYFMALKYKS